MRNARTEGVLAVVGLMCAGTAVALVAGLGVFWLTGCNGGPFAPPVPEPTTTTVTLPMPPVPETTWTTLPPLPSDQQ